MIEDIVETFSRTLLPNKAVIDEATARILEFQKQPNYPSTLMMLAAQGSLSLDLRQALLANLKLYIVKRYRKVEGTFILPEEKERIRANIFQAVVRSSATPKLANIYRAVVKFMVMTRQDSWDPIAHLLAALPKVSSEDELLGVMTYALPVAASFQVQNKHREVAARLVKDVLPAFRVLLEKYQSKQVVYLAVKIFYKLICNEYDPEMGAEAPKWLPFIVRMAGTLDGSRQVDKANKWAMRVIFRILNKHCSDASKLSKQHLDALMEQSQLILGAVFAAFKLDMRGLTKNEFARIKCLIPFVKHTRLHKLIENHIWQILQNLASGPLLLSEDDYRMMVEEPNDFLCKEDGLSFYMTSRSASFDFIKELINYKELNSKGYKSGPRVYWMPFAKWLAEKLEKGDNRVKAMAMEVAQRVSTELDSIKENSMYFQNLLALYVIPQLLSSDVLLRARACKLLGQFGRINFSDPLNYIKIVEGVYSNFVQTESLYLSLRAGDALNKVCSHSSAKDFLIPKLQSVFGTYISILSKNEGVELVQALEGIIQKFKEHVGAYSLRLTVSLVHIFKQHCEAIGKGPDEEGNLEFTASGCISSICEILQNEHNEEVVAAMNPLVHEVVDLCFFLEEFEHMQDASVLLARLFHKQGRVEREYWQYFPLLMYRAVGLPESVDVAKLGLSQKMREAYDECKGIGSATVWEDHLTLIKNYIAEGFQVLHTETDLFGENLLQLLLRAISHTVCEFEEDESIMALNMLFPLLEHAGQLLPAVRVPVLQIVFSAVGKAKAARFKAQCVEVIFLMAHFDPLVFDLIAVQIPPKQVVLQAIALKAELKNDWEIQRDILGVLSFMRSKHAQDPELLPEVGSFLFHLVDQLIKTRLDEGDSFQTDEEEDLEVLDDEEDILFLADETYTKDYRCPLESVHEVMLVKEMMCEIQKLGGDTYQQLTRRLTEEQRDKFRENVDTSQRMWAEWLAERKCK